MGKFKRSDFVPLWIRGMAGLDQPLPIGHGQTISQPSTVRQMLTWLAPQPGDKVLDIGSGSGWTSAILSELVGSDGHIDAVERIPALVKFGRQNCAKYDIPNITFHQASDQLGLPEAAPYDRILVSAGAETLPSELLEQLRPGGKLVIPVENDILEITKHDDDTTDTVAHEGFVFVPLI